MRRLRANMKMSAMLRALLLLILTSFLLLGTRCRSASNEDARGGGQQDDDDDDASAPLELRPFAVGLRAPREVARVNLATEAALVVWEHASRRRRMHGVLWDFVASFEGAKGAAAPRADDCVGGLVLHLPGTNENSGELIAAAMRLHLSLGSQRVRAASTARMAEDEMLRRRDSADTTQESIAVGEGDAAGCCMVIVDGFNEKITRPEGLASLRSILTRDTFGGSESHADSELDKHVLTMDASNQLNDLKRLPKDIAYPSGPGGSQRPQGSARRSRVVSSTGRPASRVARVVLYAPLGMDGCRPEFDVALRQLVDDGLVGEYIWRPAVINSCVPLDAGDADCASIGADAIELASGYGVQMNIKNMEYKAIDEKKKEAEETDGVSGPGGGGGQARGDQRGAYDVEHLLKAFPGVSADVLTRRQEMMAGTLNAKTIADLKIEKDETDGSGSGQKTPLDSIGIKVAQRVIYHAEKLRRKGKSAVSVLNLLEEITHNFPSYASRILKMTDEDEDIVEAIRTVQSRVINPGMNAIAVNGRIVKNNEDSDVEGNSNMIDVFQFADFVGEEMRRFDEVERYLVANGGDHDDSASRSRLRHLAMRLIRLPFGTSGGGSDAVLLDLRSVVSMPSGGSKRSHVDNDVFHFLNDVERDKRYKGMPSSLTHLMSMQAQFSRFTQLRMNIVTAIIILDSEPSTDGAVGKQAVLTLQEMLKANESSLPIRYGIVLTNRQPNDVMEWGRASAYERACRAFKLVKDFYGSRTAIAYLADAMTELHAYHDRSGDVGGGDVDADVEARKRVDEILFEDKMEKVLGSAKLLRKPNIEAYQVDTLTVAVARELLIERGANVDFLRHATAQMERAGVLAMLGKQDGDEGEHGETVHVGEGTNLGGDSAIMVANGMVIREADTQGTGLVNLSMLTLQQATQMLKQDLFQGKLQVDEKNYIKHPQARGSESLVKFSAADHFLRGAYSRYNKEIIEERTLTGDRKTNVIELVGDALGAGRLPPHPSGGTFSPDDGLGFAHRLKYFWHRRGHDDFGSDESESDGDDDIEDDDEGDGRRSDEHAEYALAITHWAVCPLSNAMGRRWLRDAFIGMLHGEHGRSSRMSVLPFVANDASSGKYDLITKIVVLMTSHASVEEALGTQAENSNPFTVAHFLLNMLEDDEVQGVWIRMADRAASDGEGLSENERRAFDDAPGGHGGADGPVGGDSAGLWSRVVAAASAAMGAEDGATFLAGLRTRLDDPDVDETVSVLLRRNYDFIMHVIPEMTADPSASALVTNGRYFLASLSTGAQLASADVDLAAEIEVQRGAMLIRNTLVDGLVSIAALKADVKLKKGKKPVAEVLRRLPGLAHASDIVCSISSILSSRSISTSLIQDGYKSSKEVARLVEELAAVGSGIRIIDGDSGRREQQRGGEATERSNGSDVEGHPVVVDWIIDPLSKDAQRITPVLRYFLSIVPAGDMVVNLHLNPKQRYDEMPLKNYYAFALPSLESGDGRVERGGGVGAAHGGLPVAIFPSLPAGVTLTLHMDVNEAWLVEAVHARQDLDNIVLDRSRARGAAASGEPTTPAETATFEITSLIVTGHCYERVKGGYAPPRGLQLHLGSESMPHMVDTLVMKNLGYFQMQVQPGKWTIGIAPGTRSDMIYEDSRDLRLGPGSGAPQVMVDSYSGNTVFMEVRRRKGMERMLLVDDDSSESGSVDIEKPSSRTNAGELVDGVEAEKAGADGEGNSIMNMFARSASNLLGLSPPADAHEAASGADGHETIHIFSVASGHLYERFIRIMILSVLEHARAPVKFWFIKNYMSPQFKAVMPEMAAKFGFDYELITYKWPSWLRKQTDKQRTIWAYKILFLDVLFPQELDRVIFVDADQIIRTDMNALMDMDLDGAPYGYTPFCDNNKEMDGYRFWRQGFWKTHLDGRPYHISALYVVDLKKFRSMAAGDKLRVIYDNLSRDPNSLSNLDQDLPNYAQAQVPIFSLPTSWLWCESWCGTDTKAEAKTIDLCNNPMTKEPKLVGARRIVPEWDEYDERQQRVVDAVLTRPTLVSAAPTAHADADGEL